MVIARIGELRLVDRSSYMYRLSRVFFALAKLFLFTRLSSSTYVLSIEIIFLKILRFPKFAEAYTR